MRLTAISVADISTTDRDNRLLRWGIQVQQQNTKLSTGQSKLLPLTPAVFFILFALADGERHGYAVMQQVEVLSDGKFRMGPGTLYTTIQRLLELALIEETANHDQPEGRRRYYKLTAAGRTLWQSEISRMEAVVRLAQQKKLVPRNAQ
jgi:DNA-binding PadR family transcriptional regulator